MAYDTENVFAKILRGEIPCSKVHETDHALAFQDINPQAKVHVLVIPKGAYVSWDDFSANASATEQADYVAAIGETVKLAVEPGAIPGAGKSLTGILVAADDDSATVETPDGVQVVPRSAVRRARMVKRAQCGE